MKRLMLSLFVACSTFGATAPGSLQLPAFPLPSLVRDGGAPKEFSAMRLLRELHRGGVHGSGNFETLDAEYALLRGESLGVLAAWLESACRAVDYDVLQARTRGYDGTVFARLLSVATSLAALRQSDITLAMPIGVLTCRRQQAWGDLPGDGAEDAYVIFATDTGIMVYDPPTRQLSALGDFPNKVGISHIRF
ncbi:MAG: hypothetical protein NTV51_21780 [Verrucomicrobia bacterium]|nr:hypothetical protein [Verrucomicrobiota bacterium]